MRNLLFSIVTLFSLCAFNSGKCLPIAPKPNIIFLLLDDWGYGDITATGGAIAAPNIAAFKAAGVTATDYYTQFVCTVARQNFRTGLQPGRFGMAGRNYSLNSEDGIMTYHKRLIEHEMSERGYYTFLGGKWHMGPKPPSNAANLYDKQVGLFGGANTYFQKLSYKPYGINTPRLDYHIDGRHFRGDNDTATVQIVKKAAGVTEVAELEAFPSCKWRDEWITDSLLSEMERCARNETPLFADVNYSTPHSPIQALASEVTIGGTVGTYAADICGIRAWMFARVDAQIGRVMAKINTLDAIYPGYKNNTLIVLTSDNGAQTGTNECGNNSPYLGLKGQLRQGGVKVPFFAVWAGQITAGTTTANPIHVSDLYPTFCKVGGYAPKKEIDGIDVLASLKGGAMASRDIILSAGLPNIKATMYWSGSVLWKLVWQKTINFQDQADVYTSADKELFNLTTDPTETTNVLSSNTALATLMENYINGFEATKCTPTQQEQPDEDDVSGTDIWIGDPLFSGEWD